MITKIFTYKSSRALRKYVGKTINVTYAYFKKDTITIFQWGKPLFVKEWNIVNEEPIVGWAKDIRICPDRQYVVRDKQRL